MKQFISMAVFLCATTAHAAPTRSGLLGLGIGLEAPLIGAMYGFAAPNKPGVGYSFGAALAYEITPAIHTRVFIDSGQSHFASAQFEYLENGKRLSASQPARWQTLEVGAGGSYVWQPLFAGVRPFVGADVAAVYRGYTYTLNDELAQKLELIDLDTFESGEHQARAWSWGAGLRMGGRVDLTSWLASQCEVSLFYGPNAPIAVSNTREARDVLSANEHNFLVRATYSVRFGL